MNKFIIVLFLFALVSCQKDAEEENYRIIKVEDFEIISLTSEKYYFEEIINPSNIGLVGEKVLISEAWRVPEENPRNHIINSKDWTYDKPKRKHGEGPLEIIDASIFYKVKKANTFWTYSMNTRKLVEYSMSDSTLLGKSEWKMTEPMMDLWFFTQATDSSYLGTSREDKNRILEFDKAGDVEHLYLGQDPRYLYRDAVVTEKNLFALYAGVSLSEFSKTAVMAVQIWVFDHKGKPLWKLMLDRSIINFVVNEESNEIYGLTTDENPGITVYNIPKELL
jgi:hypothetical protein